MSGGQAGTPRSGSTGLRTRPCHPRMLQTLKELEACSPEAKAKAKAFQLLLFLVGTHLFKVWGPGGSASRDWQRACWAYSPRKGHSVHVLGLSCVLSFPCSVSSPRFCGRRFLLFDGWGDWNCGQSDLAQATQPWLRSPTGPPRLTLLSRGGRRGGETTASGGACSGQRRGPTGRSRLL